MHTVRNRKAASPRLPDSRNLIAGSHVHGRTNREEMGFMLRNSIPSQPAFPSDMIIPPHRGAVITSVAEPEVVTAPLPSAALVLNGADVTTGPTEPHVLATAIQGATTAFMPTSQPTRPIGRKAARKAARRAAAQARTEAMRKAATQHTAAQAQPDGGALVETVSNPGTPPENPAVPAEVAPAMTFEMTTLADRVMDDAEADLLLATPMPATASEATLAASAPLSPQAPSPVLPFAPLPTGPLTPLPRNMALAPRRKGLVDAIAFALVDSGRRLARWSSLRRRADEDREKLRKAEARMRAMEAQLAALQALQERVRQAGG